MNGGKVYNPQALSPFQADYVSKDPYRSQGRAPDQVVQPIYQSQMPPNFYMPDQSKSVDLKTKTTVNAGAVKQSIFSFTVPQGYQGMFYQYALLSASNVPGEIRFHVEVGGSPILMFHGDPTVAGNPLNLPTSGNGVNDFSDQALVRAQIIVPALKAVEFFASNTTAGNIEVGVRLVGYVDSTARRRAKSTGV